jgi:hypothetical protein
MRGGSFEQVFVERDEFSFEMESEPELPLYLDREGRVGLIVLR